MARTDAVWGIDIGNCSLKALRCRADDDPNKVVAEAFDFIEYPKLLTQPGAEPAELIHDALRLFLSRNSVKGCRVAVSAPGQNGLARFIRLPPIEAKKIPDIVRYEAKQQIPFDLNDVIWDYQRMGGGMAEESGFVIDAEVGLFAMKRDQVFRALEPFDRAGIPVDIVQLTPLALYNFVYFDQMHDLPPPEAYDADDPPPSTVILSLGTDSSDLVITNGFRVWQRSIPIGGSHFTKALSKELKITFAKAEYETKRNAATAPDPKAVFQAMRPVFNDLLTEIQRSISYFTSVDRAAKIASVLAMGNAMKLPGLRRYLAQSLGYEVERLEAFTALVGSEVTGSPVFRENQLCFGVAYGLTLQGLKRGPLRTNLLPKEILKDRLVRAKKPWAIGAAAVLMLGYTISVASYAMAVRTTHEKIFGDAEKQATAVTTEAAGYKTDADKAANEWKGTDQIGANLVENVEGRLRWMELLRAISAALPADMKGKEPQAIEDRSELHIRSLDCQQIDKEGAKQWLQSMYDQGYIQLTAEEIAQAGITAKTDSSGGAAGQTPSAPTTPGLPTPGGPTPGGLPTIGGPGATPGVGGPSVSPGLDGPSLAGATADAASQENLGGLWLIQLTGYHYHNRAVAGLDQGAEYVRNTLIKSLREGRVYMPNGGSELESILLKDLGIKYPALIAENKPVDWPVNPDESSGASGGMTPGMGGPGMTPGMGPGMGSGMMPGMGSGRRRGGAMPPGSPSMPGSPPGGFGPSGAGKESGEAKDGTIWVRKLDFKVQFLWEPIPASQRKQRQAAAQQAGGQQGAAGQVVPGTPATPAVPTPAVPGVPGAAPPVVPPSTPGSLPPAIPGPVVPPGAPTTPAAAPGPAASPTPPADKPNP